MSGSKTKIGSDRKTAVHVADKKCKVIIGFTLILCNGNDTILEEG